MELETWSFNNTIDTICDYGSINLYIQEHKSKPPSKQYCINNTVFADSEVHQKQQELWKQVWICISTLLLNWFMTFDIQIKEQNINYTEF